MKMRGLSESSEKFAKRAGAAGPEYLKGVQNPRRPWKDSTLAGTGNYNDGVTEAIARGAFEKGVGAATDADWLDGASGKGVRNYPVSVKESGPRWSRGYARTHAALSGTILLPRGPRNSPGNYERSKVTGEAASKARTG